MNASTLADVAAAISRSAELSLAVKATLALAAGLTISAAASRARSSVRHLVLAATFGTLLALPFASAFTPSLPIVVPVSTSAVRTAASVNRASGAPAASPAPVLESIDAAPMRWTPSIAAAVRAVWTAGAILLLASLLGSMWRLNRIRRTAVPWLDAPRSIAMIAARAGDSRAVDLLVHEDVAAPLTCGLLRPAIIFPPDAREWSEAEIGRAVIHEFEHVKRADWAVQIAARATCAAYWFHPLAWVALRKLSLEAERTCDDAVVRGDERTEYAEQLVSLAQRLKQASAPPVLAMASRSDLSRRVTALLDARQRRGPAGAAATIAAVAIAVTSVLAIGPLRAVGAAPAQGREQRAALDDRALYRASERGDVERIAALIANGADVNAAIAGDGSPLIGAARAGRLDAVRLLLDRGADPNLGVEGDGSPLIMAAARGHLPVVDLLIAHGAIIDKVVDRDENALIQASGGGHLEVVKFLVSKGADVNARVWADGEIDGRTGEWRTPLVMARRGRHAAVEAFLRSAGARD